MAKIAPITIRSTDGKFLCNLIDFLNKSEAKPNEKYLITAHSHEEFDFDKDSGINLIYDMAVALKAANQRLAKIANEGSCPTVDEWSYTQQTIANALRLYEKIHGKVPEQPNVFEGA